MDYRKGWPHMHQLCCSLLQEDKDRAVQVKLAGCPYCQGKLDVASYSRKPRGFTFVLPCGYEVRFSFSCRECRKRTTPPSVRYYGRRVYSLPVFVLALRLYERLKVRRYARLHQLCEVSTRTIRRWCIWWRCIFPASGYFKAIGERFNLKPALDRLPWSLVELFSLEAGSIRVGWEQMLRFFAPLEGGINA